MLRALAVSTALGLAIAAGGCSTPEAIDDDAAYLGDARFRRSVLERSLVSRDNGYSRLRLAHYASGAPGDWDELPEFRPRTSPITISDLGSSSALRSFGDEPAADWDALDAGERAFFEYPVQLAPYRARPPAFREAATDYGLWLDETRGVGGLVRTELADGTTALALTCASCHVHVADVGLVVGLGNARLDIGRLVSEAAAAANADTNARAMEWGRGRVDVTTAEGSEPVRIPDLRPVRFLSHLHHDATLVQTSHVALAVRIETLIITSQSRALRPPRAVALALARYLWTLGEKTNAAALTEEQARGEKLFDASCARCHRAPGFTGMPVSLDIVGTDPRVGKSLDRGTGAYRVPSLRGVRDRGLLLHDASVSSLEVLFHPARTDASFERGVRPGAIPGHVWGLELEPSARSALLAYVKTL